MTGRRRAEWLGLAAGAVQSLDFLRERAAAPDQALTTLAVPAVIVTTVALWALAGLHTEQARNGALAGLRAAAVTTLTLWAAMLLSGNPLVAYACWHAVAFLGMGAAAGASGTVLPFRRRRTP